MKNKSTFIFSLFLFFSLYLSAQNTSQFQVEAGTILHSSYYGAFAELKYQVKSVDFGLRYLRGFKGKERVVAYHSGYYQKILVNIEEYRLANRESIEFWINYKPNFQFFKPILGIGYAFDHFKKIKTKQYDEQLKMTSFYKDNYWNREEYPKGFLLKFGYAFKNFRIYVEKHFLKNPNGSKVYNGENNFIAVAYNIGVLPKKSSPEYIHSFRKKPYKSIFFRLEAGISYAQPLHRTYTSTAQKGMIQAKIMLNNGLVIGLNYLHNLGGYDYDKGTLEIVKTDTVPLLLSYSRVNGYVRSLSFFVEKIKTYTSNADFFYGVGVSYFFREKKRHSFNRIYYPNTYQTDEPPLYYSLYYFPDNPVITQNWNIGTSLHIGFRTGLFSNKLVLNLPFGKIPTTIEFQTAVGLNVRKWWEKREESRSAF